MTKEEVLEQLQSLIESWELCEADLNQTDINAIKYIIEENKKQDQIIREAREYVKRYRRIYDIDGSIEKQLDEFDILASPKRLLEILDRNVK